MRRLIWMLSVTMLILWLAAPAVAGTPEAIDWLRARQSADGGFAGDFDTASALGSTMEAVFAMVAAGEDPTTWTQNGNTPISFLESRASSATALPGDNAKLILAAMAAGRNPREFGGVDLVASLEAQLEENGLYGGSDTGNVVAQALAMMALHATGRPVPDAAVDWLVGVQLDDGSWSWNGDTTPGSGDSNSTALVVQALVAAGGQQAAVDKAVEYLHDVQNEDSGFPYQKPSPFGTDTDANSTAYVVQALVAVGDDPEGDDWTVDGTTPVDALSALQLESGGFAWQAAVPGENFLATAQAIPALEGKTFLDVIGSMDVGQAVAPSELPATGGASLHWAWGLVLLGLVLSGAGLAVRYGL
jgi:prenyltransferase beta subunit